MKSLSWATLLATVGAISSAAASSPTSAQRVVAAPAPVQAPAPASKAALLSPAPAQAPAAATKALAPKATAGKISVPTKIFSMKESEMITVSGKQVSVGEIKRDIKAQIVRQAGPPKLVNVASHKVPMPATRANAAPMLARQRAAQMAVRILDCTQEPPKILAIEGSITPDHQFTLVGNCFGDQIGDVKFIGQFPGGNLHLTFAQWTNGRIVAAVPAVSGSPDQVVAISTVRRDKVESTAQQANFTAARERVEVPARLWSPGTHFEHVWNVWDDPHPANPATFDVTVNHACSLDNMTTQATTGQVTSIDGFSDGPPYAATVQVAWAPQTSVTDYTFTISDEFDSVMFDVKAWANCPVGVAP